MAEIKTSNSAGKRSRAKSGFPEEGGRSALSRIGGLASGAGGSALSTLDADEGTSRNTLPSSTAGGVPGRQASAGQEADSDYRESAGGLSISFGAGAIVMNDASKSPEEMAREIVKPLSRELKKLGYLSS